MGSGKSPVTLNLSTVCLLGFISGVLSGFGSGGRSGLGLCAYDLIGALLRPDARLVDVVVIEPETACDDGDSDELERPLREPRPAKRKANQAHD